MWNLVTRFTRFPQVSQSVIRVNIDYHTSEKQHHTTDKAGV